jgi:hypothetical protein
MQFFYVCKSRYKFEKGLNSSLLWYKDNIKYGFSLKQHFDMTHSSHACTKDSLPHSLQFFDKVTSFKPTFAEILNVVFDVYEKALEPYDYLTPKDVLEDAVALNETDTDNSKQASSIDVDNNLAYMPITPASCFDSLSSSSSDSYTIFSNDSLSSEILTHCISEENIHALCYALENLHLTTYDETSDEHTSQLSYVDNETHLTSHLNQLQEELFYDVDFTSLEPLSHNKKNSVHRISFSSSDTDSWQFIDGDKI